MKDKISRAKKFVLDHKVGFAVGTGVIIGVGACVVAEYNLPATIHRMQLTSEDLEFLQENLTAVISRDISPREKIWIVNAASPENKLIYNNLSSFK